MKLSTSLLLLTLLLSGCATAVPADRSGVEACRPVTEGEIAALFDRWNASLASGDPTKVGANYAEDAVLLATVSNKPRVNSSEREDYFSHFLENEPTGTIDWRRVSIGCNTAIDSGLYTFAFRKTGAVVKARFTFAYRWTGERWLIVSHHSSAMPER
jgi:uncharacterized protein (TIGR02246 family)